VLAKPEPVGKPTPTERLKGLQSFSSSESVLYFMFSLYDATIPNYTQGSSS
jgi:hypothetical protein